MFADLMNYIYRNNSWWGWWTWINIRERLTLRC